eukprot:12328761-Karenia_brevis.AAC.1
MTQARAGALLKKILVLTHVQNAHLYRPHDLRRGHAKDLQASGENIVGAGRASVLGSCIIRGTSLCHFGGGSMEVTGLPE